MLEHFACRWDHADDEDPICLYEEINGDRMEVRKIHEYRDGRLIRTDSVNDSDTSLSWEPLPSLEDIDGQPDFSLEPLTAVQFQETWEQAMDSA